MMDWFKRLLKSNRPAPPPDQRGVALLAVLVMVVMFTAFVVDFSYNSRMRYTMASHDRDAARAEAIAVSGIRIYQLLLMFGDAAQGRLSAFIPAQFKGLLGSGSMIVRLPPGGCVDTGLLRMLGGSSSGYELEEEMPEPAGMGAPGQNKGPTRIDEAPPVAQGSFLDFEGDFLTCAKEESTKMSLNGMVKTGFAGGEGAGANMLLATLRKEEYQPLFREANIMPEELVSNIIDWGDLNSERANGRGYEDNLYNNLADPYNSKNAPYDSVSELHMVAGMTDDLYAVVAPLVTSHTVVDKISLPLAGIEMLDALVRAALPNHRFTDADIQQIWMDYQLNAALMPPTDVQSLTTILKMSMQLSSLTNEDLSKFVSASEKSRPKVFTITSTGRVGDVERTVEVVVDISKFSHLGGLFYYWREE